MPVTAHHCVVGGEDTTLSPNSYSSSYSFSCTVPNTWVAGDTYQIGNDADGMYVVAINNVKVLASTPSQISQPITVTMANGAPSATVTITGGNPSPSTFSADGTQHTISQSIPTQASHYPSQTAATPETASA